MVFQRFLLLKIEIRIGNTTTKAVENQKKYPDASNKLLSKRFVTPEHITALVSMK
jgi:hypothetical protein